MPKRYGKKLHAVRSGLHTSRHPMLMPGRGSEGNNNGKERCFRERSCLETTPQTTVFFTNIDMISPWSAENILSYDANKWPEPHIHVPFPLGKKAVPTIVLASSWWLEHWSLFCLPEDLRHILLSKCHPSLGKAVSATSKSPAIEVSGSDIEPN